MKLSDFDFHLPEELIATYPVSPRDSSRLLFVPTRGDFRDLAVTELSELLRPNDLLVFNNTKVIPARLFGTRGNATIEVVLHQQVSGATSHQWTAFLRPAKKVRMGETIIFADHFSAECISKSESGEVVLRFNIGGPAFSEALATHGTTPLPPYIAKKRAADDGDKETYQTIFAEHEGAVAAPTAGLHFTENLLETLREKNINFEFLTLHVGAGTFLPVKAENISEHQMHSEWCEVSVDTAEKVNQTKASGGRIIPVGTTSLRTLESASDDNGWLHPYSASTNIFITPGYRFKCADLLFTNFHTPKSTLFMLVCAFAGMDRMKAAYQHAVENQYRFYSYGDACLLELNRTA